jgi:hypothetical protein
MIKIWAAPVMDPSIVGRWVLDPRRFPARSPLLPQALLNTSSYPSSEPGSAQLKNIISTGAETIEEAGRQVDGMCGAHEVLAAVFNFVSAPAHLYIIRAS